jgi:hypothetical protein
MNSLAELGFIVVQIDGMGTSNRSKKFHDVAWKNIKDAGFPDRILWMKAAAAKYPYMDVERVGVYGTSAGGQNSAGAVLFHADFYDVAVSSCGCHDNRMDKIWWNEAWMGWPVDQSYIESSNVENAHLLKGQAPSHQRRDGQQRGPCLNNTACQCSDKGRQGLRLPAGAGDAAQQRWRLWGKAQAGLLRGTSAWRESS